MQVSRAGQGRALRRDEVEGVGQLECGGAARSPQWAAVTAAQRGAGAQARGRRAKPGRTWAHPGARGAWAEGQDEGRPHTYGDRKVPIEPQASDDGSS